MNRGGTRRNDDPGNFRALNRSSSFPGKRDDNQGLHLVRTGSRQGREAVPAPAPCAPHTALLRQARGPIESRTRAVREILCAFQGVVVASSIVVDESAEAADRGAVEIEDAPRVDF